MDFLLIGHRTSGKTTLASAIAQLHPHLFSAVDLDRVIEQEEERTCAQIIAQHEPYFRQLEIAYLDKLLSLHDHPTPHRLITPGAGCLHLPNGPLAIWIQRDGWQQSALSQRARLRPRDNADQELEWMRQRREPVWARRAHATLPITHGTSIASSIQRLLELLLAMLQAPKQAITHKTFLLPSTPNELARAHADQLTLSTHGVELRSDLFPDLPGQKETLSSSSTPYLLSLRTPDLSWLTQLCPLAAAADIDIDLLDKVALFDLDTPLPEALILSTHPGPNDPRSTQTHLQRLALAAQSTPSHHAITLKLAAWYDSYADLLDAFDLVQNTPHLHPLTFLPQGRSLAWMRPWLAAHLNATNYLPTSLHPVHHQTPPDDSLNAAYFDLQDWLPHLASDPPTRFDALLGDPVDQSQGDWWHRMESIRQGEPHRSYLKIPVPKETPTHEWRALFTLLERMRIHGLSITSPHKRTICDLPWTAPADGASARLEAANTLAYDPHTNTWLYCDTDHHGLLATLEHIARLDGVEPGSILLIGQGGVSPAITAAIEASPGWSLLHHASAREGWTADTPSHATLVINAAGDLDSPYLNPPSCTVWLDLHYRGVRAPPASCTHHLNGDIFFAAQAQAQRAFWARIQKATK